MPLQYINNILEDTFVAVWKLSETTDALIKKTGLSEDEKNYFFSIKNNSRKMQWLGCRLLLKHIFQKPIPVFYTPQGKPYLTFDNYNISMSHTKNFSAIIVSKKFEVGIDIEKQDVRLKRISTKMASDEEIKMSVEQKEKEIENLTSIWCAKEALYKILGSAVYNFSEDISTDIRNINEKGFFNASVSIYPDKKYVLRRLFIEDHILVYVIDN